MPEPALGRDQLGDTIAEFDRVVEAWFDRFRGIEPLDRLFVTASRLGDFSLIWQASSLFRGARRRRADEVVVLGLALAAESLLVNQGVKRLFKRSRPTEAGAASTPVRRPQTSAFPSGHATAAVFHAVVATAIDARNGPRRGHARRVVWWWLLALVVSASRIHVRIHHPSDVVGGMILGAVLGSVAARIIVRILD
jgi:undecaprenyl-diphosphatase